MADPVLTANEFRKLPGKERALFIYTEIRSTNTELCKTNKHLGKINGKVARHEKFIWIITGMILLASWIYGKEEIIGAFVSLVK